MAHLPVFTGNSEPERTGNRRTRLGEAMRTKRIFLAVLLAGVVTGCGGSGDDEGIQLVRPSLEVKGLTAGQSVTVALNGGSGDTFSANRTYRFSDRVDEQDNYELRIVGISGGASCLFANGQTTIKGKNPGEKATVLQCGGGTPTGPVSQVNGPFKMFGWTATFLNTSTLALPVSIQGFDGTPLTGATTENFTFLDNSEEIEPNSEFSFYVQPMPRSNVNVTIALAIDISSSLSSEAIAKIKTAAKNYVNSLDAGTEVKIFTFDKDVVDRVGHTANKTTLVNAIDAIPESGANNSTNLYGAIIDATNSRSDHLYHNAPAELGYTVVITDGQHTVNTDGPDSTSDAVDFEAVYAVGIGNSLNEDALQEAIDDPDGVHQRLVRVSSADQVGGALNTVNSRFQSMLAGLHVIWYGSPRDGTDNEIRVEATPLGDCAVGTGGGETEGCIYFWNYDASGFVPRTFFFVGNKFNFNAGETVIYTVPDWNFCNNTDYQWNITENQGTATGTESLNGRRLELELGNATPIDIDVEVVDSNGSACTASTNIQVP